MTKTLLVGCPGCMRHLRVTEVRCPFCGRVLPSSLREQEAPAPVGRLSRAALYALRAGALSVTAAACGGAATNGTGGEGNGSSSTSASFQPAYGGVPVDASVTPLYGGYFAPDAETATPIDGSFPVEDTGPGDGSVMTIASYGGFIPSDGSRAEPVPDGSDEAGATDATADR